MGEQLGMVDYFMQTECELIETIQKEATNKGVRLEGYEEGIEKGIERGIRTLIQTCMELGVSGDVIIEKCAEKYEMTKEEAGRYMKECCV